MSKYQVVTPETARAMSDEELATQYHATRALVQRWPSDVLCVHPIERLATLSVEREARKIATA